MRPSTTPRSRSSCTPPKCPFLSAVFERQRNQNMSRYLCNAWYVAGFADEFTPEKLIARTLLDQPIVMFRNETGSITALADRCPHRFAPLSAGRVCDGGRSVRCGYHGLEFGADGRCTRNPHNEKTI